MPSRLSGTALLLSYWAKCVYWFECIVMNCIGKHRHWKVKSENERQDIVFRGCCHVRKQLVKHSNPSCNNTCSIVSCAFQRCPRLCICMCVCMNMYVHIFYFLQNVWRRGCQHDILYIPLDVLGHPFALLCLYLECVYLFFNFFSFHLLFDSESRFSLGEMQADFIRLQIAQTWFEQVFIFIRKQEWKRIPETCSTESKTAFQTVHAAGTSLSAGVETGKTTRFFIHGLSWSARSLLRLHSVQRLLELI